MPFILKHNPVVQMNGTSARFDPKDMQDSMVRLRMSFRELAKASGMAPYRLRRIAAGFSAPTTTEMLALESVLKLKESA